MNNPPLPKVLAILGPTASGKSQTALRLAERFSCPILSCDSLQIYQEFDIGSAKPSTAELQQIDHYLINALPPNARVTVAAYKDLAEQTLQSLAQQGIRQCILVGGTGLYFHALYAGLSDIPAAPQQEHSAPVEELYARLLQVDPTFAHQIQPLDIQRITRALDVYKATGQPLSAFHGKRQKLALNWRLALLKHERPDLYARIEIRTDSMLEQGLLAETQALLAKWGRDLHGFRALGYRQVLAVLEGDMDMDMLAPSIVHATYQFAKRQDTWFRRYRESAYDFHPETDWDALVLYVQDFFSDDST